ncbi:response regulator [Roseomonas sp. E05]|uniref:response regulator n=1 Tax=Roseomonas sp. E05 TaxID=3046310 RepID=UPI0024BB1C7D|nr:response regulator [Roseomonas sp. E05]MDJ0387064.1 response regulator [Roseomonas sp. E05]
MTTILVVDDEFLIADLLATELEDQGYRVLQAHHGKKALEILAHERPALIVTDFMMPLMNGLEMAQAIKSQPQYRDLPIILLSGAQGAIARRYPELFAAVYDKPIELWRLSQAIRALIGPARLAGEGG